MGRAFYHGFFLHEHQAGQKNIIHQHRQKITKVFNSGFAGLNINCCQTSNLCKITSGIDNPVDAMMFRPGGLMLIEKMPHVSDRKIPVEFHPTRPYLENEIKDFMMSGGIPGAIGGTPLVRLEKIFAPSH
jgi:hypothetical protein